MAEQQDVRLAALQAEVAAVLGLADVYTEEGFIELGGDSLTAVLVCEGLAELGFALSEIDLLEAERLEAVVPSIQQSISSDPPTRAP